MSVQSELDRIISAIGAAYDAVEAKGGTVPQSETIAGLAAAVQSIQTGGGAKTEVSYVQFTEDTTCKIAGDIELCETAISAPWLLGLVAYSSENTDKTPILSLGIDPNKFGILSTNLNAYAFGSNSYSPMSKGYVYAPNSAAGNFNSAFSNCLRIYNGKVYWNMRTGLGYNGGISATFTAGTRIFVVAIGE